MYLLEYIKHSQAGYPSISKTPLHCLRHLFYVNGNGYDTRDGNITTRYNFWNVELRDIYKDTIPYEDYKDFYQYRNFDKESADIVKFITTLRTHKGLSLDDDIIWAEAVEHHNKPYNELDNVENYTLDDLKLSDTYYKWIQESDYIPILHLSENYYLQYEFNENTDKDTIEIAIAMSNAYIRAYDELLTNGSMFESKKISYSATKEQALQQVFNDRLRLNADVANLLRYL